MNTMSNGANRIEVTMETLLDSVALAEGITERVARAAGFNDDDCMKIGMSVREGVINAFRYGNEEQRNKKIQLNFEVTEDKFVVHIADQGRGFDLHEVPDPLAEENLLKTSGRGIFLMRTFMDEFEVRRTPQGGAELIMAKKLNQPRSTPHLQDK
jgi:serine/threonine-protein kinase RsbW